MKKTSAVGLHTFFKIYFLLICNNLMMTDYFYFFLILGWTISLIINNYIREGKGSGVWPSMVTHTLNLCSAFNPSKCTHTVVNIHLEQWAANAAAPGEQLGVRCLAQGLTSVVVLRVERVLVIHSPPPTIPAGPETQTHDLRVTSPTLYPLGHDCPLYIYK